ncbi:MAG: hypothetical protein P8Y13_14495 [Deinococcales bacterium]
MRDVVITTAIRTPVGRAHKGLLKDTRPDDLAGLVLAEALKRTPGLEPERIDDVLLGNAHPEGEAGYNMARIATQIAGLPDRVAGATINRFCASGLQVIVQGVHSVATGMNDVVFAGGSDCTSRVPIGGRDIAINRALARRKPGAYHSMGQTAEEVARRFGVSREEQDRFALASHRKAIAARKAGKLDGHVVPVPTGCHDGRDGARGGRGARPRAAGGVRTSGRGRRPTGDHGDRAGAGDPQAARQDRHDGRRRGPHRDQRGLRQPVSLQPARARHPRREAQ